MNYEVVNENIFKLPVLEMAQALLGQYLVHEIEGMVLVGRIVETEAYRGAEDQAAHSFSNKPTKRTKAMFGESGHAYIYQMHTHTLINVVGGAIGTPHGALIRAVEPVVGKELMRRNRGEHFKDIDLTNGPGKLTKALSITKEYYGHNLRKKPLYLAEGTPVQEIATSPRVGVSNAGEAAHYLYRFFDKNSLYVSKFR